MLDNCQLCETENTGVMYVNGILACYSCQILTNDEAVPILSDEFTIIEELEAL